jgi:hypothetical protein
MPIRSSNWHRKVVRAGLIFPVAFCSAFCQDDQVKAWRAFLFVLLLVWSATGLSARPSKSFFVFPGYDAARTPTIASEAAGVAAPHPASLSKAASRGNARFVLYLPTAPGERAGLSNQGSDTYIPVNKKLMVAAGIGGGRLFGLASETSRRGTALTISCSESITTTRHKAIRSTFTTTS